MATNKTQNLKLNSWIGTDGVKREEINENFTKIDTKLGSVDAQLTGMASKSELTAVSGQIADKASKAEVTAVSAQLAEKATQTDVANLQTNLTTTNNTVAQKANQSSLNTTNSNVSILQTQVTNMGTASPKGTYATLADLQTAFPSGTTGVYVVSADGKWYFWNGTAWTAGGLYQATGIADKGIGFKKIEFADYGANKINPYAMVDGKSLNSSGVEAADALYSVSEYIPVLQGITYIINASSTTFKRPSFYDANKVFVALVYSTTSTTAREYTPSQNGFIRVPVLTDGKSNISLSEKSVQPTFKPFEVVADSYFKTIPKDGSVESKMLKNGSVTQEKTSFLLKTENLFNKDTITPNKLVLGSSISDNTAYDLSDFIPVNPNQNYRISAGLRTVSFFDANQTYVNGLDNTTSNKPNDPFTIATTPEAVYMRISVYKEKTAIIMLTQGATDVEFVPFGYYMSGLVVKQENILNYTQKDILSGKKLLVFGDSIMSANFGVGKMLSDKYNMSIRNLASGGATVTNMEGSTNIIINRVQQGITEGQTADYIIFNGLTNDSGNIPLEKTGVITTGYNDVLDLNTFAGAFENLVKTLITTWTNAKILYIRPHNMDSRGDRQRTFGDLALNICKKWSVPYVDLYNEGGLNSHIPILKQLYTVDTYSTGLGDGTHPNEAGYRMYYLPRVEAKLKAI